MADQYYTVPENPQYNENIRRIQNSDPVNADMTVNPVIEALMRNAAALLGEVTKAQAAAGTAQNTADAAQTAAGTAQATADAAKMAATTAQTAADAAKTAATTAQGTANSRLQYQTGEYPGTNVAGNGSPNTLYFPFTPKILIVVNKQPEQQNLIKVGLFIVSSNTAISWVGSGNDEPRAYGLKSTWGGNYVSWYHNVYSSAQLNEANVNYGYIAIG